jgi:hypothetical protein
LDYICRECGRGGQIHSSRRCFSCVLAERTQTLLAGPGGDVPAQLCPLLEALCTVTNPATVVKWLGTSRTVRYFLQWAHGRGLAGDLTVPLPPRQEPARLLGEDAHIRQLDRCLTDEAMPLDLRVGGTLVLLFGMLVSRITQLTKDNVIEDGQATYLSVDGHRLMLPSQLASLVRQLRDQDEPRWTLGRLGTSTPWLFPGQSPGRPAVDVLFGVRLHRYGINAHAGRNTGRLALAAELPASVLADLTGISISTAERCKRDWAAYVGQRAADDREGIDSPEHTKQPAKHANRN